MDDPKPSRREVFGTVAVGLAASTLAGTAADAQANAAAAGTLVDPRDRGPKPPFAEQSQPWPGLASRMVPPPDHGERSYRGSGRLAGRKALITGGDSGMGRAAAIAFAREGADVVINHMPEEQPDADQVLGYIRAAGRQGFSIPGDLRDEAFCQHLVAEAVARLGGLDILVSNAAYQRATPDFLDITTEQFDRTFRTNVYAMFWVTKAAVPHMPPGSAIINTTSVNAYDPGEAIIDYAATKGAIMIWTKGLAKQLAKKGIRVNGVAPGPIWTPLQVSGGQTADGLRKFGADTPFGRPGQPAELASIYVQLAADSATYSTGQIYGAVGGRGGP